MELFLIKIVEFLNNIIWSPALIAICILAGLYFSFRTRFVQVRRLRSMAHQLFRTGHEKKQGTTSFQAFALALSGRVGTGNVVGVATAIGFGGPGAIVWMWIIAFFGAGTAFAESTLSQIYKERHGDDFRGGPAYYIEKGLKSPLFGMIFAIIATIGCGIFYPPVQCNGIAMSMSGTFNIPTWLVGIGVSLGLGLIIIGGVKRIAHFAQVVAPLMAIAYILVSIFILILNAEKIPSILSEMISSAFGFNEALGGIMGSAISWGVKRGIYSNEAGQGTGAIASGSAGVSHPVKQGLAQAFSVYIDTLLVCTATAIMILSCKTYNIVESVNHLEDGTAVVTYLQQNPDAPLGEPGVFYTSKALGSVMGMQQGNVFISIILFFFAFTTIMAFYYYAETNLIYFLSRIGVTKYEKLVLNILRICTIGVVFLGSVTTSGVAWTLGDIGVGTMAWINIISVILLSPQVFKVLKDFERQKDAGLDPEFQPEELGIENTDSWEKDR